MQTTATNKKISEILRDIANERLILRPPFQRRLVWRNKHKIDFIKTILDGFPFPEIFIATGDLDVNTGEGTNLLVDGQQRITTLRDYFHGSKELKLLGQIPAYAELDKKQKESFLSYLVVVRDLGKVESEQLKDAFVRINSTAFPLNAVELDNAQYEGEFKNIAQTLADISFFSMNEVFSIADIRRMRDLRFCLRLIATVIDAYFQGYSSVEKALEKYNESFSEGEKVIQNFKRVFKFLNDCNFPKKSRAWQQADIFTVLVELYWAICRDKLEISPLLVRKNLQGFFLKVDAPITGTESKEVGTYRQAASQATNNRNNQIYRGRIIRNLLEKSIKKH